MTERKELQIEVPGAGEVSALLDRPEHPTWILALAHGAGAGMRHPFLQSLARELGTQRIATLRYQFPYMENARRVPDPPAILTATVRAAVEKAAELAPGLPILAGGKSMGGRMTSTAASQAPLPGVRGLVFFGFPLHPPKRPGIKRAEHLSRVTVPMLFLQGTRDTLADLSLLQPICAELNARETPRASSASSPQVPPQIVSLHIIDTADHSFHMLKRSGRTDAEVLADLAREVATWANNLP